MREKIKKKLVSHGISSRLAHPLRNQQSVTCGSIFIAISILFFSFFLYSLVVTDSVTMSASNFVAPGDAKTRDVAKLGISRAHTLKGQVQLMVVKNNRIYLK